MLTLHFVSSVFHLWLRITLGSLKYLASCADFGSSGSAIVREWRTVPGQAANPVTQYSFVGPLTMSKGCDLTLEVNVANEDLPTQDFIPRGRT